MGSPNDEMCAQCLAPCRANNKPLINSSENNETRVMAMFQSKCQPYHISEEEIQFVGFENIWTRGGHRRRRESISTRAKQ